MFIFHLVMASKTLKKPLFVIFNQNLSTMNLEINLISAQNLPKPRNKKSPFQTYAVASLDASNQKLPLVSRIDKIGDRNPSWNDRFMFPIDADTILTRPNACLILKIYRTRKFRKDKWIGTAQVRLEDLLETGDDDDIDDCSRGAERVRPKGVAFYVRNLKDEEPQAILNLGVEKNVWVIHQSPISNRSTDSGLDYRTLTGGDRVIDFDSLGRVVSRTGLCRMKKLRYFFKRIRFMI